MKETNNVREEFFQTANLKAAVALATLGFKPKPEPVTRTIRTDGKESTIFWFDTTNEAGLRAEKVHYWMTKGGDELEKDDPENIINYLRAYAANRDVLVDIIRSTPRRVMLDVKGKKVLMREDATPEDRAKIASRI